MRAVVQRVARASVSVDGSVVSAIGPGLLVLLGVTHDDGVPQAEWLAAKVRSSKLRAEVIDGESVIGGGSAPSSVLPSRLLALTCDAFSADELAARLRKSQPPIVARVEEGRVLLDLRTMFPEQDQFIADTLRLIA